MRCTCVAYDADWNPLGAGIAGSMPSGVMGQDFAIQYIRVCDLPTDALHATLGLLAALAVCRMHPLQLWWLLWSGPMLTWQVSDAWMQASELMEALRKNLRQEHVLIHDFLSTFYTQVGQACLRGTPGIPRIEPRCLHAWPDHAGTQEEFKQLENQCSQHRICVVNTNSQHKSGVCASLQRPMLHTDAVVVLRLQTLNPLQMARCVVKSYPWCAQPADSHLICSVHPAIPCATPVRNNDLTVCIATLMPMRAVQL